MGMLHSIFGGVKSNKAKAGAASLFDCQATSIDGVEVPLSEYKGLVVLVVNTASKCGFTKQYEELEKLYQKFKGRGFVILGFPSNDFMGQEPASNADIKSFCSLNYNVTFPLFSKAPVSGSAKQPVYRFLTEESGYSEVRWTFEKFLVDSEGAVVGRWRSFISPLNKDIQSVIEKLLGQ